jgi:hypothetical protein
LDIPVEGISGLWYEGVVTIDSCEYITFSTFNGYKGITHKGNCKYCREWAENKYSAPAGASQQ